jgi:hypothetical protein
MFSFIGFCFDLLEQVSVVHSFSSVLLMFQFHQIDQYSSFFLLYFLVKDRDQTFKFCITNLIHLVGICWGHILTPGLVQIGAADIIPVQYVSTTGTTPTATNKTIIALKRIIPHTS